MGKLDELMKTAGGSILESASHRAAPVAMPTTVAAAGQGARPGTVRSKVAQVIRLDLIERDPNQPREEFDPEALDRLAGSLATDGLMQPIAVRWDQGRGVFVVVVGERRWRAAKLAGLESIPCTVMDREFAADELLAIQCKENLLREDLKPIEEAKAFRTLMELHGWSGNRLSKEMGISQSKVMQSLALLDLPAPVQDAVEQGVLPATTAYEIAKHASPEDQSLVAEAAVSQGLRRSEVAELARSVKAKRPAPAARPDPVTFDAEGVTVKLTWKKAGSSAVKALKAALKQAQERERAEAPSSADAA